MTNRSYKISEGRFRVTEPPFSPVYTNSLLNLPDIYDSIHISTFTSEYGSVKVSTGLVRAEKRAEHGGGDAFDLV